MQDHDKRFALYKQLVSLYPKAYRERFGNQILQTTEDMLSQVTDEKERRKLWLRLALDMPVSIGRQRIKHLGGNMNNHSQRLMKAALYVVVSVLAVLAFPYLRAIGTTWMNTAGMLRMVGLALYVVAVIIFPLVLAIVSLFGRPKATPSKG